MGKKIELVKKGTIKKVRAEVLGINRKNIYHHSLLEEKDLLLKTAIEDTHKEHPAYGHKRLGIHLHVNHKRIRRVMKKFGIKPPRRRVNHYCTRSIAHRKYPNLIYDMQAYYENHVWCSDTSEFKFHGSKWYLPLLISARDRYWGLPLESIIIVSW